jgi:hypothetical protein
VRILELEPVFSFPSELCSRAGVPTNFDYGDSVSLELLDFSVCDFYWMFHELELVIETDFFERDYHVLLEQTFLEVQHVEHIMNIAQFLRELELIGHGANPFGNLEWSHVSRSELAFLAESEYTSPR